MMLERSARMTDSPTATHPRRTAGNMQGLSKELRRHPPPATAQPEVQEMPPPRWHTGPSGGSAPPSPKEGLEPATKRQSLVDPRPESNDVGTHYLLILERLDVLDAEVESMRAKQDKLMQAREKDDVAHRAQLECVTERVWKAERELHEAQTRQEDAIEKANAAFKKHAWDVMQDRQHLMLAIDQVNKNFAEVTCTIADNNNQVKAMQESLTQFQLDLDQVSHTAYTQSGSMQTTQQQLAQLQCTVQAVHDTVMQMTPHSQFVEAGSAQRALAEQCNELQARMQEVMGDVHEVRARMNWEDEAAAEFHDGLPSRESRDITSSGLSLPPPIQSRPRGVHVGVTGRPWEDADEMAAAFGVPNPQCGGTASFGQAVPRSPRSSSRRGSSPRESMRDRHEYKRGHDVADIFDGLDFDQDLNRPFPGQTLLGNTSFRR
mmetsp:Transcript_45752/g.106226  ORF Transcript_45752/g.106226 Transcript_45752/m.106226 type:complete len:433 (+) Transcript_45752:146-1444(+)